MLQHKRLSLEVTGTVQGVGFRPFVYRLAKELNLVGWVHNSPRGVAIAIEGDISQLEQFLQRFERELPPLAQVRSQQVQWQDAIGYTDFTIQPSSEGEKTASILPDIATCRDCLKEIGDPSDRRYRYPFTNCTHCGPRYSIILDLPYDRPQTTMKQFAICPECQREYEDPGDRRFHAQPNACPRCGPQLQFWDLNGNCKAREEEALQEAIAGIKAGEIVAVKGLGGFHFMVDACNETAVQTLRQRKYRPSKPFALMYPDLERIYQDCEVSPEAEKQLRSPQAPIILLPRRNGSPLPLNIAPKNPNIGAMLPYTPLHHLLMQELGFPVVATSGNRAREPICIDESAAILALKGIADSFLVHNRPILRPVDDSVMALLGNTPLWLRRSRGYAPLPLMIPEGDPTRKILAVGGHLKNTIALYCDRQIFLSQHIGDITNIESLVAFKDTIKSLSKMYDFQPDLVVCDAHPDYPSSQFAHSLALPILPVQHHYAHILAVMADHQLNAPVLGLAWDGTGYGLDGTIWGGEFILVTPDGWQRVAHLKQFRLPGGEQAVKQPWRIALGLLGDTCGETAWNLRDLPPFQGHSSAKLKQFKTILDRQINTPLTSSMGRLFDAIASLLGLCQNATYEGEAAMSLEFAVTPTDPADYYPFNLLPTPKAKSSLNLPLQIDYGPIILTILQEMQRKVSLGTIAAKFHHTLVEIAIKILQSLTQEGVISRQNIVLSGGCFQNCYLLAQMRDRLQKLGYKVYSAQSIPPNDGGLSVGQIFAALRYQSKSSIIPNIVSRASKKCV
ncbi:MULTISPECIES: carbamoyltransferase HypF [Spirulina sp. CCY15215]|uniref:carbamoyltransferase HypF n=1 Tax=Spirulina sp. CCY15215 TaxID=2767591 RepID=UPI001950E63C|nr:carbamoyltransferase HypF [Spirulina major]